MAEPTLHNARLVLLGGPGPETHIVYHALRRRFHIAGVVMEKPLNPRIFLQRRIRRLGLTTVLGQIGFKLLIVPVLRAEGRRRLNEIKNSHGLDESPIPDQIITTVDSVNSDEARQALRRLQPDVVVINGTRIIAAKTLDSVPAPFVNTHTGLTPHYRGVHGGYWAMRKGEPERFGVTVHLVDTGIDTGKVLASRTCWPGPKDNFCTYPYLQLAAGIPALCDAVADLIQGVATPKTVPSRGTPLWSHPTATDYLTARIWSGVR